MVKMDSVELVGNEYPKAKTLKGIIKTLNK